MFGFLNLRTFFIMASAALLALLCVLPATRFTLPFSILAMGLNIGDTLFHEMGHASASWLMGRIAIPMIFTLFGADQASGFTIHYDKSWYIQAAMFGALGYGCYWVKQNLSFLFIPAQIFTTCIVILAISREEYQEALIAFMGHGGSMLVGGFFLFRAWINMGIRSTTERWLSALFGFFILFYNMHFAYQLAYDPNMRQDYADHQDFGITHNDFVQIAEFIPGWSVQGIAHFTIGYAVLVMIAAFAVAIWLQYDFGDEMPSDET